MSEILKWFLKEKKVDNKSVNSMQKAFSGSGLDIEEGENKSIWLIQRKELHVQIYIAFLEN